MYVHFQVLQLAASKEPLAWICHQLHAPFRQRQHRFLLAQVKEAIQQHFDFATPAVALTADEPSTPRLLKRLKMIECKSDASQAVCPG